MVVAMTDAARTAMRLTKDLGFPRYEPARSVRA